MPELPEVLALNTGKGYVRAPAGFGKTHLIAESINYSDNRQLILTHTYSGVNALKKKMEEHNVSAKKYKIDTIASWALRLCLAYPQRSGWRTELPEGDQWKELYVHCTELLKYKFLKRILCSSYERVYVDEYQDCTTSQHKLILSLSEVLPVCILGDPLQAIFEFGNDDLVDWDDNIHPTFVSLGALETPWRWKNANKEMKAAWLKEIRRKLETNEEIDLTKDIPEGVAVHIVSDDDELRNKQINVCKYFRLLEGENVIAIHKGDNRHKALCNKLAKNTSGLFSSIEEVEGKRLFSFVRSYDRLQSNKDKILFTIDFLRGKCMSGVNSALSAGTKRGDTVVIRDNTKNPDIAKTANRFLEVGTHDALKDFLLAVKSAEETTLYARDLFNRLIKTLTEFHSITDNCLLDAANRFQRSFRYTGRPINHSRIVGTTLLVKGLEFDHAIVLEAASLSKKDLYVALTRGSKSLTIISRKSILQPGA